MARKREEGGEHWSGMTAARFSYDWELATKRLLGEAKVSARVLCRWRKEVIEFRKEQAERLAMEKTALKEVAAKSIGRRTSTRTGIEM